MHLHTLFWAVFGACKCGIPVLQSVSAFDFLRFAGKDSTVGRFSDSDRFLNWGYLLSWNSTDSLRDNCWLMEAEEPSLASQWDQDGKCSICQSNLVHPLVCCGIGGISKHAFHMDCIHSAVAVDSRCPVCRVDWGEPVRNSRHAWVQNGSEITDFRLDTPRRPVLSEEDEFQFIEEEDQLLDDSIAEDFDHEEISAEVSPVPNSELVTVEHAESRMDSESIMDMEVIPETAGFQSPWQLQDVSRLVNGIQLQLNWPELASVERAESSMGSERQLDINAELVILPDTTVRTVENPRLRSPWQVQDVLGISEVDVSRSRSRTNRRSSASSWQISDGTLNPFPAPLVRSQPRTNPAGFDGTMLPEPVYNRRNSLTALQSSIVQLIASGGQLRSPWQITAVGEPVAVQSQIQHVADSKAGGSRASASDKLDKWAEKWIQSMNDINFQSNAILREFVDHRARQIELLGDLFRGCAPSTLAKHYGPWVKWKLFTVRVAVQPTQPGASDMMIYMDGFKDRPGLRAFRSCMNFLCFKIRFDALNAALTTLKEVITCRLLRMVKPTTEAPPWSLFSAAEFVPPFGG